MSLMLSKKFIKNQRTSKMMMMLQKVWRSKTTHQSKMVNYPKMNQNSKLQKKLLKLTPMLKKSQQPQLLKQLLKLP